MKRFLALPAVILAVAACSEQPTQPRPVDAAPSFARGPAAKATGGAYDAALDLHLSFTAQGTPASAKGNVNYRHDATGRHFRGEVSCYSQAGNRAAFSGTVEDSNVESFDYFLVFVVDNGEGDGASGPDGFRVLAGPAPFDCTVSNSSSYPGTADEGNIQVHR